MNPKAYLLSAFLSSRYFEIRPFILFLQAHPESTMGFCLPKNRGKYPCKFLISRGIFWPSLGHLDCQHHTLASVWPSKRHFLEIEEGIQNLIQNFATALLCMHMLRNFEPPFYCQLLSPLSFLCFRSCKIYCSLITKNDIWIHKR